MCLLCLKLLKLTKKVFGVGLVCGIAYSSRCALQYVPLQLKGIASLPPPLPTNPSPGAVGAKGRGRREGCADGGEQTHVKSSYSRARW